MDGKDGGQAFPVPPYIENGHTIIRPSPGMTLRDWFAGQALAGMCANADIISEIGRMQDAPGKVTAILSYELADLMLAERERKP